MARYTYNAGLVTQTLDKLYSACDVLENTNVDVQKGIDTISNARGAENINVDFSVITGYQSQVIEYIDVMSEEIRKKSQEIEEYQDAPWYKKLFATIGLGALKIVEGLGTFVENIGDGLVSVAGFVGGLFSSDFKDSVAEFVKKDHVGDAFANAYENGWLKSVNKYSVMSHESTAANVLKGIGTAAGYVIVGVATGGLGTAALGISAAAAGVGAIGSGTQAGLQAGKTFNQAFGQGVKQGVVAAGTTLLIGGLANKLGGLAKGAGAADDVLNTGDDVVSAVAGTADDVVNAGDDVLRLTTSATDDVVNAGDDVVSAVAGTADDIGSNSLAVVDDVANVADDAAGVVDDAANVADDAANATDDIIDLGEDSYRIIDADDAAGVIDDATNATTKKPNIIKRGINKVDNMITKFGTETKVGQAISNAAANAGPKVTNAIAAGSGAVAGGAITNPIGTSAYRVAMQEAQNPTVGQQLAEATAITDSQIPSVNENPTAPTNNTGGATDTGTTPVTNPTGNSTGTSGTGTGSSYNPGTTNAQTVSSPSVSLPEYDSTPTVQAKVTDTTVTAPTTTLPEYDSTPTTTPSTSSPSTSTSSTPTTSTSSTSTSTTNSVTPNDIVGNTNSGLPGSGTPSSSSSRPSVSGAVGNNNIASTTADTQAIGSEVLDTFGDVSGSFAGITDGGSTSIPTSSSPILSSDGSTSKSMIPLGAGLGAAALAGIGTKAYLDKKSEKEEEKDTLETEEWEEDADSIEVDYSQDTTEEADYLSPADEYAFQE